jgi:hypothetical protein
VRCGSEVEMGWVEGGGTCGDSEVWERAKR